MNIHIGNEIEKIFHKRGIKISVFAERMNTGVRNVYEIFKREDLYANQLKKISDILEYDFFRLYKTNTLSVVEEPERSYALPARQKNIEVYVKLNLSDEEQESLYKKAIKSLDDDTK